MPRARLSTNDRAPSDSPRSGHPNRTIEDIPLALSYDDVLLVPRRTSIASRRDVETATRLSRNLTLHIPIVSANMDTVTESAMAIEMARQGGIGIVHRFMPIEAEADEIKRIKRA